MCRATPHSAVASLIHHIELNKSGWWERATKRLIVFAVWANENRLSADDICATIKDTFSVELDQTRADKLVAELCKSDILTELGDGQFKIVEASLAKYEAEIKEGERLEDAARTRFEHMVGNLCPEMDPVATWHDFLKQLLFPLVRELGARLYELVSGTSLGLSATSTFRTFLGAFPTEHQDSVNRLLVAFFDPRETETRTYVLRHLNSYFFVEATSLPQAALDSLATEAKKRPSFKIFVDTNFLFSVLGLHENPSNEAARALVNLAAAVRDDVDVKLYVLPCTIDETRRTLAAHADRLRGVHLSKQLADAAARSGLSGLALRYTNECRSSGLALTAEEFFDPYITNLVSLLRQKGMDIYGENIEEYSLRQDVIDDIMHQLEYEKEYRDRPKSYEELRHDVILWHVARDRRPRVLESPLGAGYWVVTIDYRFMGFDSFKRRGSAADIPICLHPAALVQMLQFWVPRSAELDGAILETLRLPFMFHEFDPEAERVTLSIIRTINRFESGDELTTDTAYRVLMNRVLREKMKADMEVEEQVQLVREALVEQDAERSRVLEKAREEADSLKCNLDAEQDARRTLESTLDHERLARESVEQRAGVLQCQLSDRLDAEEMQRALGRLRRQMGYAALLASFAAVTGTLLLRFVGSAWGPRLVVVPSCLAAAIWLWYAHRAGNSCPAAKRWSFFWRMRRFYKWVLGTMISGIVVNAIYDLLKMSASGR